MLSARDLASMRACVEQILDQTATIQRKTDATDGGLGSDPTWSSAGTISCHLLPQTGREGQEAGRVVAESGWVILLPHGTDVRIGDRLLISSATYEINHLDSASSYSLQIAATCRRLD